MADILNYKVQKLTGECILQVILRHIWKRMYVNWRQFRIWMCFEDSWRHVQQSIEEVEIDFIIEQNGMLYPIEIKQNSKVTADMTSAFLVLDNIPEKSMEWVR